MPDRRPHGLAATIDLRRLDVPPGGAAQVVVPVPVDDMSLAGQRYLVAPPAPEARVDVSRGSSGLYLRLRLAADLEGPCQRCLEPARVPVQVDAREFQAAGRGAVTELDDDLDCAYLVGPRREQLDVVTWARDAVAEAVPMAVVCRADCPGLCPRCGSPLTLGPCGCPPVVADPRWAGLADLARRLEGE